MTTTNANAPQGYAAYFELRKGGMTTQVLLMPEGISPTGNVVPMSMYRRRVSALSPKRTWRLVSSSFTSAQLRTAFPHYSSNDLAAHLLSFTNVAFETAANSDWKIYKQPIIVETTSQDLEDVRNGRSPYKVFGRVWKARKALGFSKDFWEVSSAV